MFANQIALQATYARKQAAIAPEFAKGEPAAAAQTQASICIEAAVV